MALPTVEGTKLRNGRYYLNLRIPAEAAASFPGKTHLRDSLKTSDEKIAKRGVILAKAKLIEAAEDLRQQEMQTEAIAALPPDQRALFDEAGGTTRLHAQFAATDTHGGWTWSRSRQRRRLFPPQGKAMSLVFRQSP